MGGIRVRSCKTGGFVGACPVTSSGPGSRGRGARGGARSSWRSVRWAPGRSRRGQWRACSPAASRGSHEASHRTRMGHDPGHRPRIDGALGRGQEAGGEGPRRGRGQGQGRPRPGARGGEEVPRLQRGDEGRREDRRPVHAPQEGRAPLRRDQAPPVQPAPAGADQHRARHGDGRRAAELRRPVGPRLQACRRQGPPHPPQRPLQGAGRLGGGEGGPAELPRLGAAGPADRQHQPREQQRRGDRLRGHLLHRLRRARVIRQPGPQPDELAQGQGVSEQPRARGRGDLHRRPLFLLLLRRSRRRPPGQDDDHPLQPGQGARRLQTPVRRRPRRPLPRRGQGLRQGRPRHLLHPPGQPMAAREGRPQGQALAAQEADRVVHRGDRPREVPPGRRGGHPRSSGTRRSRRSASRTPSRSAGRRTAATTSTPRTSTIAPSAGAPPTAPGPTRGCGPTP